MRKGLRFYVNLRENETPQFLNAGIEVKSGSNVIILFEDDIHYKKKLKVFEDYESLPLKIIEYSKNEFEKAQFFHIELSQQQGYPKPENKYEEIFYDSQYRTEAESYLLVQNNDISAGQISKSIRGLFGINWLFFEVFADKNTYDNYIKPLGIQSRRVLNGTRKQVMENIVQLIPQGVSSENLDSNFDYEVIGKNKRYILDYHIPFQGYLEKINFHFFETKEFFGFKENTYRLPIISKTLYEILQKNKIKGCRFFPVISD